MTTAAEQTARVDDLAESLRRSFARAKHLPPVGPRVPVAAYSERTIAGIDFDLLECGHTVRAGATAYARRVCPHCPRLER